MFHKLEAPAQIMVELAGLRVPVNLLLESYAWYSPNQVALGTSFEPVEWLTLAMDLTWYQWSRYPGPYVPRALTRARTARSLDYPPEIDLVFEDTLVPRWASARRRQPQGTLGLPPAAGRAAAYRPDQPARLRYTLYLSWLGLAGSPSKIQESPASTPQMSPWRL